MLLKYNQLCMHGVFIPLYTPPIIPALDFDFGHPLLSNLEIIFLTLLRA